ncbi:methyl-accepting chemotaxis protein [Massilia aurea]|uniref:Methyl-accepting chemotaxis protein n=1 Tax=Massilia aurea TaxID=373040 RepID=A0A7X0CDE1_9BURK|nr:methyl-accepting chemotaxis protein [Massilia aurea]MBB6133407.1 methyl-accepting chemotaxis protein [Massilia aurea]
MKNLKIGTRLAFSYAAVLILMAIVIVVTLGRMGDMKDATDRVVNTSMKNQRNVAEWTRIIEVNRALVEMAYRTPEPAQVKLIGERIAAGSVRSTELQQTIKAGLRNPKSQAQLEEVVAARVPYAAARKALLAAKMAGDNEAAQRIFESQMLPTSVVYVESISKLAVAQQKSAEKFVSDATAAYDTARTTLIGMGILAIGLGVTFGIFITRSIVRPIQDAVAVADRVSSGDLSSQFTVTTRDETGQLMAALQKMNDNLLGIVTRVRAGTETIATASAEIAAGNLDLSSRTEQQAGSLEETASSMEELTSTVRQNADNARRANTMASEAASIAGQGGAVIAQVVGTMSEINASSRKIVDITSVIDSIAFQTNILALNAAVEAARAGEQGRGFAVVASEVRNLAHRSAAAAKEIKSLIDDSVQKVEAGTTLVDSAGTTMTNIVQSISLVTGIMSEISHASDEQSAGIEQVNAAITEMDQATQQNAALVEQAAAAAGSMQEQAAHLADVVSVFKTGGSTVAAHAAPAPARSQPAPVGRLALAGV